MSLGLGANLSKPRLITPGIITDSLVLKHKYDAGSVVPVSDGAAFFEQSSGDKITAAVPSSTFYGDFSISFWVYKNEIGNVDTIMDTMEGVNDGMVLFFRSGNTLRLSLDSNDITTSSTFSANRWYHIAVVQNDTANTQQIYIDGVLDVSGSADSDLDNENNTLSMGRDLASNNPFKGYLCNVGIWSGTLTQAQVKSIMNKNYGGLTDSEKTNLVSWWNLDTTLGGSGGTSVVVNSHDNTLGEELITSFVNGSTYAFDTLTTSGRNISAAVETSGDWAGAASNSLNLVEGEIYKCTFNLTYNSGTDTVRVLLSNSANGAATSVVDAPYYTNTNGAHEAYFRVKTTDSTSHLQIGTWHSSDVINFNMTDISLKRLGGNSGKLS